MRSRRCSVNVVLCTAPNAKSAKRIARTLVEEKLAACVQLVPIHASIYRWQGKLHEDREILLVIKTLTSRRGSLQARIRALHPYEVPEILFLPVSAGDRRYLKWIEGSLSQAAASKRR